MFIAWFGTDPACLRLRSDYERGDLAVVVPPSFSLAVLEALADAGWQAERLEEMANVIRRLGFQFVDPPAADLARALARGLGAHRSALLALAVARDLPLITRDEQLLKHAPARRPEDL